MSDEERSASALGSKIDKKERGNLVRMFGVFNVLVAAEAVIFAKFSLLKPSGFWHRTPQWDARRELWTPSSEYGDSVFVLTCNMYCIGIVLLCAAGLGLLLKKRWGRSLSIAFAVSVIVYYCLLFFFAGVLPAQFYGKPGPAGSAFLRLGLICAYPIFLLWGMRRPGLKAALGLPTDATKPVAFESSREDQSASPVEPIQFSIRHVFIAVAVVAVLLSQIAWWMRHPVQRELYKLKYGNKVAQRSACDALARLGPDGVAGLTDVLSGSIKGRRYLRGNAIKALGDMGPDAADAVPAISDTLSRSPDLYKDLYNDSVAALFKIGSVPALAVVVKYARTTFTKQNAVVALSQHGTEAIPVLIKIVESPTFDIHLRKETVAALGEIGPDGRQAIPVITKFADENTDPTRGTPRSYFRTSEPSGRGNDDRWIFAAEALHRIGLEHLEGQGEVESLFFVHFSRTRMLDNLVSRTPFSDAELKHLRGLHDLRRLGLQRAKISDAGLAYVKSLNNLELLWLDGSQITDAGLVYLEALTNIKWLDLRNTRITDVGLKRLKHLINLQWLRITGTRVTARGIKDLQAALPDCQIDKN